MIAFHTSKHFLSFDRCVSKSIHILSWTRIEIEVNVTVGFCLGLALAMGFPEAVFSSFVVGINSVTYLSTPFTILTHETVLSWNSKSLCSRLDRWLSCFGTILLHESPLHCEAACTLDTSVAFAVLLLFQEYRSIVLVGQASNTRQNTIWITSGLLTVARIFSRTLKKLCTSYRPIFTKIPQYWLNTFNGTETITVSMLFRQLKNTVVVF